eukprot:Ihof_evm2s436 gene=Ihof_evmTU2s436
MGILAGPLLLSCPSMSCMGHSVSLANTRALLRGQIRLLSTVGGQMAALKVVLGLQTGGAKEWADTLGAVLVKAGLQGERGELQERAKGLFSFFTEFLPAPSRPGKGVGYEKEEAMTLNGAHRSNEIHSSISLHYNPSYSYYVTSYIPYPPPLYEIPSASPTPSYQSQCSDNHGNHVPQYRSDLEKWLVCFLDYVKRDPQRTTASMNKAVSHGERETDGGSRPASKLALQPLSTQAQWFDPVRLCTPFYDNRTLIHRVLYNRDLTPAADSHRRVREIAIKLSASSPRQGSYRAHRPVYPTNDPAIVCRIADQMGWDLTYKFALSLSQGPVSVFDALRHYVDLTSTPTPGYLRSLSSYSLDQAHAKAINDLAAPEVYTTEFKAKGQQLRHVLQNYPSVRMSLARFLELTPRLKPRMYSISSSSKVDPSLVKLVYRGVKYPTVDGSLHNGVCSTYLLNLQEEAILPGYVQPSTFRLPKDSKVPIVMIARGTGVSPMKAFLDERLLLYQQHKDLGPCVLYYGVNDPSEGLYGGFMHHAATGKCADVQVAYSHPKYTQNNMRLPTDILRSDGEKVWRLIGEQGAFIYVC